MNNSNDVVTVGVLNSVLERALGRLKIDIHEEIQALDQKMMDGFDMVFKRFDEVDRKIETLFLVKADKEEPPFRARETGAVRLY